MTCPKCNDTGWVQYDHNHASKCDACCKHEDGWFELTEHYAGYVKGADNRCCKAGCGTMFRDLVNGRNIGNMHEMDEVQNSIGVWNEQTFNHTEEKPERTGSNAEGR